MKKNNIIKYIIISIVLILIIYFITKVNLKEGYENTSVAYVINLDKRKDRWAKIKERFNDSSISLERVSAVEHVKGHTGCGLSFMKVVKYAKENNLKTVLIFEDDNKPLEGFNKRWLIIKEWLDNNLDAWEIYNGGARFPDWGKYDINYTSPYIYETKLAYSIESKEFLFIAPQLLATNWIYINNKAYDKVLEWEAKYSKDGVIKIDNYILNSDNFKLLFSIPHLALQENDYSNTDNMLQDFNKTDKNLIKIFNDVYIKELSNSNR